MMNFFRNDTLEIIFERKNKKYGAYALRLLYPQIITRSGIITILAFILLMSSPMIASYFKEDREKEKEEKKKKRLVELIAPPPQDLEKPPPPVIPPPPVLKMQQFTPPKIVEDEKIDEKHQIEENKDLKKADVETKDGLDKIKIEENITKQQDQVPIEPLDAGQVDEMAKFPKLYDYLENEIEYPAYEKDAGIEGTVNVHFIVELDGSLSHIYVAKGVSKGLDEEALRVMRKISGAGKWTTAKKQGKSVRVNYVLPINYQLEE
ncbi:MAG: energy transducer TonB [Bacteroidota bacterium]|nr:energy transducer TonB [Bacteroidota bacterium]